MISQSHSRPEDSPRAETSRLQWAHIYPDEGLNSMLSYDPARLANRPSDQLPILHLPVEILGEVFVHYLRISLIDHAEARDGQSSSSASTSPPPDPCISTVPFKSSPMLLGQVCRHWRDTVLSMPALWSSIDIICNNTYEGLLPTLGLWLERSSTCPLTLHLHSSSKEPDKDGLLDKVLDMLILHIHQWKRINFILECTEVPQPLVHLPVGATKLLESAGLEVGEWAYDNVDRLWRNLHSSPSLRQVVWHRQYTRDSLPRHAPWGQLTHIYIGSSTFEAIMDALPLCPAVIALTLCSIDSSTMPIERLYAAPLEGAQLVLPYLKILFLMDVPNVLFNHITTPALEMLNVGAMGIIVPSSLQCLRNYLARSSCVMQRLSLTNPTFTEDELGTFLEFPSFSSVTLFNIIANLTDQTISLLTRRVVGKKIECLFPMLEEAYIAFCFTTPGVLSDMVKSRVYPSCDEHGEVPLRTIKKIALVAPESNAEEVLFLRNIKEEGLIVTVS